MISLSNVRIGRITSYLVDSHPVRLGLPLILLRRHIVKCERNSAECCVRGGVYKDGDSNEYENANEIIEIDGV